MSALQNRIPVVEEHHETEVIYVVVPPYSNTFVQPELPYSIIERVALFSEQLKHSTAMFTKRASVFVTFVAGTSVMLYALYSVKSVMGIDLFPHEHLESFVPIPGFGRW